MATIKINDNNENGTVSLIYYPKSKELGLDFENITLTSQISRPWDSDSNYNVRSIVDLENSTILVNLFLPKKVIFSTINFFEFESEELVLSLPQLNPTKWGRLFYADLSNL